MKLTLFLLSVLALLSCEKHNDKEEFGSYSLEIIDHEIVDFKLDKPWEELFIGYINVIKVDSIWHLWYESFNTDSKEYSEPSFNTFLSYAYSYDGIHWIKPILNIHNYKGLDNNILFFNNFKENRGIHGVSVIYDVEAPKSKRFKMVYSKYDVATEMSQVAGMVSPDGIHWNDERILMNRHSDTQTVIFKHGGRYWMFYRYWKEASGERVRKIGVASSSTFEDDFVLHPLGFWNDESVEEIHFYTNSARLLDQNSVILFPSIFDVESNSLDIKVAISAQHNFGNLRYLDSPQFDSFFSEFKQKIVAPQSIPIDNTNEVWLYVLLRKHGHDGWAEITDRYLGHIGRVKVKISRLN